MNSKTTENEKTTITKSIDDINQNDNSKNKEEESIKFSFKEINNESDLLFRKTDLDSIV